MLANIGSASNALLQLTSDIRERPVCQERAQDSPKVSKGYDRLLRGLEPNIDGRGARLKLGGRILRDMGSCRGHSSAAS